MPSRHTGKETEAVKNGCHGDTGGMLLEQGAGVAIDVIDNMAVVVEKHALAGLGSVAGPLREGSAVGITGAHECEEGISHLCGKCTWTNATTRMGNHKVGVTEPEAYVETVECAHASVEKRRLPIEPSQIERCRLYSLGIDGSDDTIAGAIDVAE